MWWAAILLIPVVILARWRLVRAMPHADQYGHLGYGNLSAGVWLLIDALAIAAGIAALIVIFS